MKYKSLPYYKNIINYSVYLMFFIFMFLLPPFLLRSGIINFDNRLKYLLIYFVCLAGFLLFNKLFIIFNKKSNLTVIIILLLLPNVVLTVIGLIINPSGLIPILFPIVNIIYILALIPLIFKNFFKITALIGLSLTLFTSYWVYPILNINNNIKLESSDLNLGNNSFILNNDSNRIKIPNDLVVLDFMFINCKPCITKLEYLNVLAENLKVYVIVDGKIDSFNSYKDFNSKISNEYSNIKFFYDLNGSISNKLKIKSYPNELIIKNNKIILSEIGFTSSSIDLYVKNRLKIIGN